MESSAGFTTEAYPAFQRKAIWRDVLSQRGISTSVDVDGKPEDFYGSLVTRTSRGGIEFLRVVSEPQTLIFEGQPDSILMILHADGDGYIHRDDAAADERLSGIVILSGSNKSVIFDLNSRFSEFIVRLPHVAINKISVNGPPTQISIASGMGRIVAGLLGAVDETLETIEAEYMDAVETSIVELATLLIAEQADRSMPTDLSLSQSMVFSRVQKSIERNMADPHLSVEKVARDVGISPRSVQKLFEANGQSFSNYLRQRRLERCRDDLGEALSDKLSISDIGFRWGFNDAAHFSRSFRAHFGISPRDWRRDAKDRSEGRITTLQQTRGWPNRPFNRTRSVLALSEGRSLQPALDRSAEQQPKQHYLPAHKKSIHWGYFSKHLSPVLEISSGDVVTVETLTQHASDDPDRMIKGDPGAESVFHWTASEKSVERRGAGPMDASIYGRGPGEGFGVHICTGPIHIRDAAPGDVLEIQILDLYPRPSANPDYRGRAFGSNAAAWWGFQYKDLVSGPRPREVVTIYEINDAAGGHYARPLYNYRWRSQCDPAGVMHPTIDYPGVMVDHTSIEKNYKLMKGIKVPVRPHFGVIAVAPKEEDLVDSVPPGYFGGNIDNWRLTKGARLFLPVSVPGALLSIGDPHLSQGDGELSGTAIECSLTGLIKVNIHKNAEITDPMIADVNYPLIETPTEWVLQGFSHPNYLTEFGELARSKVYQQSTLDLAMRDAFRKARRFLMSAKGLTEDEAVSLLSVAVDFSVTQVVDGNFGIHAIIRKELFSPE